jgi:tripartite-type tricarboxylate transporter receptor subunit TctC
MQAKFRSDRAVRLFRTAACLYFIVALTAAPADAQTAADFFRARQVRLMVGSTPGGGYDAIARLVARHLGKFIPGNPSNRIYHAEPQDGTVLGLVQRGVLLAPLLKQPNVQFDVAKFTWIGSVSPETSLVVAWHTAPVKTLQDLLVTQLIVGSTGATSDLEASARLLNATIGTKLKIVTGYPGQANVLLAMERGEVQGSADWSWAEIKTRHSDYLRDKRINLILQNALTKAPDLPDVPLAIDFIGNEIDRQAAGLYLGLKQVARPIMAGPGVPADRAAALRQAFMALKGDAEFNADAKKIGLDDLTPAGEIDKFIAVAAAASPDVVRRLTDILNPQIR